MNALLVGGTRFIGRATVVELLDHGYEVTLFNRGNHDNPFADDDAVAHVRGDRTDRESLAAAADRVEPEVVIDCVAYRPAEVRTATEVFADASYVYVSSGSAYGEEQVPKREGVTPLAACTSGQATDDSPETYGPRKAEGDRVVAAAAERGVDATSVRPTIVYGTHDYTGRFDYWVERTTEHERVLVPGDGDALWHLVGVQSVARALRVAAEAGTPGVAYNVGDRRLFPLAEFVSVVAEAAETDVEVVTAAPSVCERAGLDPDAVPFYRRYPHVLDTGRLSGLGWEAVDARTAIERAVDGVLDRGTAVTDTAPSRAATAAVIETVQDG